MSREYLPSSFYLWRHPKPIGAQGLCIGHTNLQVDKRKLQRLANQIHNFTRRHRLPKVIWCSTLQRSHGVGAILAKRGFSCELSPLLCEMNFGTWDGKPWGEISNIEIDAWCADFADFMPGGGESVRLLHKRVALMFNLWQTQLSEVNADQRCVLVVGHAGWITAAWQLWSGLDLPKHAKHWPAPPKYRQLTMLSSFKSAH